MHELIFMGLLTKMKMRRDGVFEEMNNEIADKNQKRRIFAAQFQAGGEDLDNSRGQHETRAERDEILKVGAFPALLDNDCAAEDVRRGGC